MGTMILKKPVIAVAGSSGKTTTKEMIASILQTRWKIFKSLSNNNNRRAHRWHVKQIRPYHRAVVLEFGMSYWGHLKTSCQIIQPNIGIVTMIGTAHLGNFAGNLDYLIRAKSDIIRYMKSTGTAFINADDANSAKMRFGNFRGRLLKVGIKNKADYRAFDVKYSKQGMHFKTRLRGALHTFFIPTYGIHNVYNALFAIGVADILGFKASEIQRGLARYHKPVHRLNVSVLRKDIRLIDDTFNANPNSAKAAIDVVNQVADGPKILVLGSMAELGRYTVKGHIDVGNYVAKKGVDHLFTFGNSAGIIARQAIKAGLSPKKVQHFVDRNRLNRELLRKVKPKSTILVKGSNVTRMFETVRFLQRTIPKK
ncbi:MAG: UDP-N-acetylmuramoyl-tripeptide--D-alanyl-D-alanine ligase [Candidatus Saccharibacteria bacterium]